MAAILRSSVIQTARRTFSGEGSLSVRAALHTGRNNAKQSLKRAEPKNTDGSKAWLAGAFIILVFLEGFEGEDDPQRRRSYK